MREPSFQIPAMNSTEKDSAKKFPGQMFRVSFLAPVTFALLGLCVLSCGLSAQSQQPPNVQAPATGTSTVQQLPDQQPAGSISGTVVDGTGAAITGARVTLTREDQTPNQDALSDDDGRFSFANVAPGTFHITVAAEGFSPQTSSGTLDPGETQLAPPIALTIAPSIADVEVVVPRSEVAEGEIKDQEKQRVLGVVPNFYVTYVHDAVPLTAKQKFGLAWKSTIDPVTFGLTAAIAGVQQTQNDFSGYGQGAQGFGKRFGAAYGNAVTSTFIGSAILPALLRQDPRYFYMGSGSGTGKRILYAIANAVICKGDDERWQPNYSNILGNIASGGISNLYYPAQNRSGAGLTFENALIGIGQTAATNLLEEFLIRKLTPNLPHYDQPKS